MYQLIYRQNSILLRRLLNLILVSQKTLTP